MWNGTMFVDLDWPLNASSLLSASAELLVLFRLDALALSVIATATWLTGWLAGWLSVTAGIVSKRLNLSENFFDHLVATSFKHLGPLTPIPNSKFPSSGAIGLYTRGVRNIGDFRRKWPISRKRCETGLWLLWNVNRKSWVPDPLALFSKNSFCYFSGT